MEKKHFEILLGFTEEHGVISGEITYYPEGVFTASFNESYPVVMNEEKALEYIESYIENMDAETRLYKLEYYDCAPSDLVNRIYCDSDENIENLIDNSLHPETYEMNENDTVYLMASGCGQHDTRDDMVKYIDKQLYDEIHVLWDAYHMKTVPFEDVKYVFEKIERQYHNLDEEEVIHKEMEEFYKEQED